MQILSALISVVLIVFALRGNRLAYLLFILKSLAYFPLRAGLPLKPRACQLAMSGELAMLSMTNYAHIVLFACFFVISYPQFGPRDRLTRNAVLLAGVATILMGAAVEIAQGVTGAGNCRLRDLIPDAAGALLGVALMALWMNVRRRFRRDAGTV